MTTTTYEGCGSAVHEPEDHPEAQLALQGLPEAGCICSPCCRHALDEATQAHPGRSIVSDGCCGDPAHAARVSDHNPYTGDYLPARGYALAFDVTHDPARGMDAHAWADRLRLACQAGREARVKYIISRGRIASEIAGWAWRAYTGPNPHDHHVHVSIQPWAYASLTTWNYSPTEDPNMPLTREDLDAVGFKLLQYHEEKVEPALKALEGRLVAQERRTRTQVRRVLTAVSGVAVTAAAILAALQ